MALAETLETSGKDPMHDLPAPLRPDATPMQVANCVELTTDERRAILNDWYADALQMERAAEASQVELGRHDSAEVRAAIDSLAAHSEEEHRLT